MIEREEYDRFRVAPIDPATIRGEHVEKILATLSRQSAGQLKVEKFADSVEGRPIYLATIGKGSRRVLLWSQMHGDEATHTAVLLDLLSYLLSSPGRPHAAEILANCTLNMLPLLNPDGAEHVSRFNAQGIDVNRDARRLSTPEGRALRRAVEAFRPEFAFNLHNQHARTSVGSPPRPAAVSVLAPPADGSGKETPSMRRAKQIAARFVEAVRPDVGGMISRYDDTYEPRAFGDTIQATGAATMLVEAGGWADTDYEPMVRLHFHGMLATLQAIATDSYHSADTQIYESLPESNSSRLFDCLIAGGQLLDARTDEIFKADLGIDDSRAVRLARTAMRDGRISDIGDLGVSAGKVNVDAAGCLILPGRVSYLNDWSGDSPLDDQQLGALLARGTTTVLGSIDLTDRDAIDAMDLARELPINCGFVGRMDKTRPLEPAEFIEHLGLAAAHGLIAVVGEHADERLWQCVDYFGLPLLQPGQLPTQLSAAANYWELAQRNAAVHRLFKLDGSRGHLGRNALADLQLFELGAEIDPMRQVDWRRLQRVLVAGETAWERGRRVGGTPGVLLKRG